jgi:hypothetical protein
LLAVPGAHTYFQTHQGLESWSGAYKLVVIVASNSSSVLCNGHQQNSIIFFNSTLSECVYRQAGRCVE